MPTITDARLSVGSLTATLATEQLRLAYDASNYVSFAVSLGGGLTLNPKAGQSVILPILAVTGTGVITGATRFGDSVRLDSGAVPTLPTTGAGLEMWYGTVATGAAIQAYDRDAAVYRPLLFGGSSFRFSDGMVRIESLGTPPATGAGIELFYSSGAGNIQAYDRSVAASTPLQFSASRFDYADGMVRIKATGTAPATGAGLELFYNSGSSVATIQAFSRDSSAYVGLNLAGLTMSFYPGVTPVARQLLATGTGKTVDNVITALQALGLVRQT